MVTPAARLLIAVGLALAAVCGPARGQSAGVDSAVAAANRKLMALVRRDYLFVAQQADPGQLRRIRLAVDSLLQRDSSRTIAGTLFEADSAAQLRSWSDAHFAAAILRFWIATSSNARYSGVERLDIPGGVAVGRDTVLVVYRFLYRDKYEGAYAVEKMARCPGGWCSELPVNFQAVIAMMRMQRVPK